MVRRCKRRAQLPPRSVALPPGVGTILAEALAIFPNAASVPMVRRCKRRARSTSWRHALEDSDSLSHSYAWCTRSPPAQIVQWCAAAIYRKRSTMRKELSSHHHSRNGNNRKAISNLHKGALNLQSELAAILFLQSLWRASEGYTQEHLVFPWWRYSGLKSW